MTAARVELTSEVFWTCHLHALSTEVEEVMGLLLGDVLYENDGSATVRIWAAMPQIRTDRRKDRVEASPEQMARCSAVAERFSAETGTLTRVVGWYHSHPHITVLPSHVDVRTQAMYQMLDPGFVGLIISAFNEEATMLTQKVQMTAFQSVSTAAQPPQLPNVDASDIERAMAASNAAAYSSGDWTRREVPLAVVDSRGAAEQTLSDMKGLLLTLFREERAAFEAALEDAHDADGNTDPLAALQHAATYQQHLASLIELVLGPALHSLRMSTTQTKLQQKQLDALEPILEQALQAQREQARQQASTAATVTAHLPASCQLAAVSPAVGSHGAAQLVSPPPAAVPPAPATTAQPAGVGIGAVPGAAAAAAVASKHGAGVGPTAGSGWPSAAAAGHARGQEPWSHPVQEPWSDSEQEVTDAAKARLAALDRSDTAASAAVPIAQRPHTAQSKPDGVGSPDVFDQLFGLDDFGRVVTLQDRPPGGV